jgi:hypothetical protein
LLNVHDDEYHDDEIQFPVFLKSILTSITSPRLIVNGIKRVCIEPALNIVSSLQKKKIY